MGSVVTKEIGELNEHLDKVIEANEQGVPRRLTRCSYNDFHK